jgi:predicted permease
MNQEDRGMPGAGLFGGLWRDVRYGARMLRKSPVFTTVAVASLALGIGANTAVFSLVDTVMLRLLPVRNPQELVVLGWGANNSPKKLNSAYSNSGGGGSRGRWHTNVFTWPMFETIRHSGAMAEAIGYSQLPNLSMTVNGESHVTGGLAVSGNYFTGLGVTMALGRPLLDDDDHEAGIPAAVISYRLWESAFGLDPHVAGRTVYINRAPHVIVGVTPREFFGISTLGFFLARQVDLTLPIRERERLDATRTGGVSWRSPDLAWVQMMGRLRSGTSGAVVTESLSTMVLNNLPESESAWMRGQSLRVIADQGSRGITFGRDQFKDPFNVLAGLVALTLLMACANLAGLLLARATAREREIGIRLAVGAGRTRLVRQLLTESMLLALAGAAAGLVLAWWGVRALLAITASGKFAIPVEIRLDGRVLAFTVAVAILTALLFGLAPALRATRIAVRGPGQARTGMMRALVAVQIGVALLLVIGSTLAVRSLAKVRGIPLGFNPTRILLFGLDAGRSGYDEPHRAALYSRLIEEFNRTPGVAAAAASIETPLSGLSSGTQILIDGAGRKGARVNGVSERFLEVLHIPVVAGRPIGARDMNGPRVALINETAARTFFGTSSPLSRRFRWDYKAQAEVEIVGVVKDAKYDRLKDAPPPTIYMPWTQAPWGTPFQLGFEILPAGDPNVALAAIRRAVRDADAMLPLMDVKTMERQIDDAMQQERLLASLVSLFGGLTLVLACVGLYGMVSYTVSSRTREIGVRMALGADRLHVLGMVTRQVALTAAGGLAIGLPAAWAVGRFAESMLYGVKAHDAASFAGAAVIVIAVAGLAASGPARRAMRVDPGSALRHE